MIGHIFIANRGEIACRIIKTCQRLGITTSLPFIKEEVHSRFVQMADHAIAFEQSIPSETYLNVDLVIEMAKKMGADAVHPGYGFLSENPVFASACHQAGLIFIGPHADSIELMASKSKAKSILKEQGLPIIPGYEGEDQSVDLLLSQAEKIGFPVLIKASMGGGGKGMRCVESASTFLSDLSAVKREAMASFGSDHVIVEKYIANARHIEVQVLADQHDQVVHVFERECTIQRRYQKVVEESPASIDQVDVLENMFQVAKTIAHQIKYCGAGTVEFIYDSDAQDFYFLEMNTRLQVEHPVTEAITGIDLVEWQIRIANGEPLMEQAQISRKGYAMELRLYGEDPQRSFMPCTGPIHRVIYPTIDGGRIDYFLQDGDIINPYFDPMLAKLIMHGATRQEVFQKMKYLLDRLVFFGPTNNASFLKAILEDSRVQRGEYTTQFLNEFNLPESDTILDTSALIATLLIDENTSASTLSKQLRDFRNNRYQPSCRQYQHNGKCYTVFYDQLSSSFRCKVDEQSFMVSSFQFNKDQLSFTVDDRPYRFTFLRRLDSFFLHHVDQGNMQLDKVARFSQDDQFEEKGAYISSLPGTIAAIFTEEGQQVEKGDRLISTISMKMEHVTEAHTAGVVKQICVKEGDVIAADTRLLIIESD